MNCVSGWIDTQFILCYLSMISTAFVVNCEHELIVYEHDCYQSFHHLLLKSFTTNILGCRIHIYYLTGVNCSEETTMNVAKKMQFNV